MPSVKWNIHREGRAWNPEEFEVRWNLIPEKTELIGGKIFWSDEDRLNMLAMLLENIGVDAAVRLGNPAVWRAAVAPLQETDSDS